PAYVHLRPRIDRMLFVERHAFVEGIEALLDALARGLEPEALLRLAGERLHALLQPESCDVYAVEDAAFVRVFSVARIGAPRMIAPDADMLAVLARQPAV